MSFFNKSEAGKLLNKKLLKNQLSTRAWIGTKISMQGLSAAASEKFGSNLKLTFKDNGTCSLEKRGEVIEAKWEITDKGLFIHGEQIETEGDFNMDESGKNVESFLLYRVERYGVNFISERILSLAAAKEGALTASRKRAEKEKGRSLKIWQDSQDADLSTCTPEFADLLKSYDFHEFDPIQITPENKEELKNEYFDPILSLGLQHTSWDYFFRSDDDRIIDGYEKYRFNQKMDLEERKSRDGELVMVPYEEVRGYVFPRIIGEQHPIINKLEELLQRSRRYRQASGGFEMRISADADGYFDADLVEAWQGKYHIVIHMIYGNDGSHAWFLMEKNADGDSHTYLGGSVGGD